MAQNYRKLVDGLNLVPKASTASNGLGDLEVLSSTSKLYFHNGTVNSEVLTGSSSSVLTNKLLDDSTVYFVDTSDNSKAIKFDAAGTTGTSTTLLSSQTANRVLTMPDATDTLVGRTTSDTLTNKTIDAASNTISNLTNSNLSGSAAISNANLASMAAHTFKGNNTGSPSTPLDLTATQLTAELNIFTSSLQGLVPASGGGTTNFLRADGTFAAPPDTGATSIGTFDSQAASANGLVISGSVLYAQSADATHPGMVNNTTQTMSGAKTFSTSIATPIINDNGSGLSINSSSNQDITVAPAGTGRLKLNAPEGVEMQQITTPSNPSSGANSLYFKADNNLYSLSSGGAESLIGSGGGSSGVNFLTLDTTFQSTKPNNFNFESNLGDWVSYNNGGVAGTIAQDLSAFNTGLGVTTSATRIGQKFVALISGTTDQVTFQLNNPGAAMSGNLVCDIYNDSSGLPGTLLATSDNYNAAAIGASPVNVTFNFTSPATLGSGNTYHAVVNFAGVTFTGNFNVLANNTDPYPSGNLVTSTNSGSSWFATSGTDLYFDIQSTGSGGSLTLTGGSASFTMSRTTTSGEVLDGVASLKVVKSAADNQNQGVSCVANIPLGYRGQVASFSFPFKVISGSLIQGDLEVIAYDVTNSQLITPVNNSISTTGIVFGTLPIPSNTTQIRFGINFASTSASAVTFSLDDVQFGPQELVFGPTMTDPQPYIPTFDNIGTPTNVNVFQNQEGKYLFVNGSFTAGTIAAAPFAISLPPGLVIDPAVSDNTAQFCGFVTGDQTGTGGVPNVGGLMFQLGSSNTKVYLCNVASGGPSNNLVQVNANQSFNASNKYSFWFKVPIQGFATNVVQQNASTFQISNYLANGVQVTGSDPTQLGQYRALYRASGGSNTLSDCSPLAIPPTVANGIYIDGGNNFATAGTATIAQVYKIFVGKNKQIGNVEYFSTTGRTGQLNNSIIIATTLEAGAYESYDPTTGIYYLDAALIQNGGTNTGRFLGTELQGSQISQGYFDFAVSQAVVPVQVTPNRSEVMVYGGNGHGSTNDCIRVFSSIGKNIGSAITYVSDSTNGDSFQINEDGVYSISYTDYNGTVTAYYFGISVNSTQLTTSIGTINIANLVQMNTALNSQPCNVSSTTILNVGDIIRPHVESAAGPNGTIDNFVTFRITKVSN